MCVCFYFQDAEKFREEFERCQQQLKNQDTLTADMKKLTVEEGESADAGSADPE